MLSKNYRKNQSRKEHMLIKIIPLIAIFIVGISLLYFFVINPQSKETGLNASFDNASQKVSGLSMKNLKKIDSSFCDDHYVSEMSIKGFTSPYGYYYFDQRQLPENTDKTKKQGLLFYDYNSHKSSMVNCRIAKDNTSNTDKSVNTSKISADWDGGAFYRDKLFLIKLHQSHHDDGFDLYRGNPDGTDMKKIYSSTYRTHTESVYCDNKVYFSLTENRMSIDNNNDNSPTEAKIVSVDLNSLQEKTLLSKKGCDARIAIKGFYKDKIYFEYEEDKKKINMDTQDSEIKDNIKEESYNSYNLKSGELKMLSSKIDDQGYDFDGKFLYRNTGKKTSVTLSITNLETNDKMTLPIYKNIKLASDDDNLKNDYHTFDGKVIFYTESNKVTDKLNCYDCETKKLTQFTSPVITDPKCNVNFIFNNAASDGLIFEKHLVDKKSHSASSNLCYISKKDYYAGKPNFIDFDY